MNRFKLSKVGVKATEAIERFNGDKETYERILYNFVNEPSYGQMVQALKDKDVKAAFAAAHSLKGIAGNLSMVRLYDDIVPLVEELRAGKLEKVEELLPPVAEDYAAIIEVLKQG